MVQSCMVGPQIFIFSLKHPTPKVKWIILFRHLIWHNSTSFNYCAKLNAWIKIIHLTLGVGRFTEKIQIQYKTILSTRSLIFPSYQGDSTIFHKGNFLKLKGVVLSHPPFSWSKERAHTTYKVEGTKREKIPTIKERGEHSRDRRAL